MMSKVRSIEATFPKPDKPDTYHGYRKVEAMLGPVYARVPSQNAAFDEIFKSPKALAAAFLIDRYFANNHYHNYNMGNRILGFLGTGKFGKAPLPIFEKLLAENGPDRPNTVFAGYHGAAVNAGRAILGGNFGAWYRSIRGIDYDEEIRRVNQNQERKK
jgi:hypothetical protein